jgi:hypothetical protein
MGLTIGTTMVQAEQTPGRATISEIQQSGRPLAPEPQSPLEFQMRAAQPGGDNSARGASPRGSTPVFLWQIGKAQLVGTASLTGRPELGFHPQASATLKFPHDLELRISFLYDLKPPASQSDSRFIRSYLLFKYSMDYRVMPNLQVGLTGYLYKQRSPGFLTFKGPRLDEPIVGLGPGVKYDLGRWSFIFQSQLETGTRNRDEGLNNWFRVWYAF